MQAERLFVRALVLTLVYGTSFSASTEQAKRPGGSYTLQDVSSLREACSIQDADNVLAAWKQGLCTGVMLAVFQMNSRHSAVQSFCVTASDTSRMRETFLSWAKRHPELRDEVYMDGLVIAMSEAFPCKKEDLKGKP